MLIRRPTNQPRKLLFSPRCCFERMCSVISGKLNISGMSWWITLFAAWSPHSHCFDCAKIETAKVHATCITPALMKKVFNQVFWMFGVSNGLRLMVPNLRLRSLQCSHALYMRVPESSFDALHIASGQAGVFSLYPGRKISQHRT